MKKTVIFIILIALSFGIVHAQETATGRVTDSKGQAIIGVGVVVTGTTQGTITSNDGSYSLPGVKRGATIEFSAIGYTTRRETFNGGRLDVVLEDDAQLLESAVIVGYGVQKKVNVTGSVSVVNSEVLQSRPVANVAQALQGQVPGLSFSTGNMGGELDNAMTMTLRGTGTIGSGSKASPLVLIDGVESDINTLSPADIESISVLKDAASASVYGAKGAFGVILVTTKSGKSGKTRISVNSNTRFDSAIRLPEMVNSYEWMEFFNAARLNSGQTIWFGDGTVDLVKQYEAGELESASMIRPSTQNYQWIGYTQSFADTDWYRAFFGSNVPSYENNVSMSGGNDKVTYRVSGTWLRQKGLLKIGSDKLNRYNLDGNLQVQITPWLKLKYISKWVRSIYDRPSYFLEKQGFLYQNIARRWPTNPVKDYYGNWFTEMDAVSLAEGGKAQSRRDQFTNQVALVIEPIKGWQINLEGNSDIAYVSLHEAILPVYNYNAFNQPYMVVWDPGSSSIPAGLSRVIDRRNWEDFFSTNIYSNYSWTLGNDHNFTVMAGFNAEKRKYDKIKAQGDGLSDPSVPYLNQVSSNPLVNLSPGETSEAETGVAGVFGRINYNYKEKYLFEANARYDGSSRFVGDKRWTLFPSVSAGWNIANEAFFDKAKRYVDTFKLRASWGQLGNTNTSSWYPSYQAMTLGNNNGLWLVNGNYTNTAYMPGIVSSSLTWETIENWNVGLDVVAFDGRLQGSFDWFTRYTYDMVGPAPTLPAALGTDVPKANNADLRSRGWELDFSWRDHIKDFHYGIRISVSDAVQKVLSYPNDTKTLPDAGLTSVNYYSGMTLGEIWGYETEGIANSQEEMDAWLEHNRPDWGNSWGAGDIMYRSIDGKDGVDDGNNTLDNHGDLKIIGNTTPRYEFGITLDASWKGFDFRVFLQGVGKRDFWPAVGDPYSRGTYFWGAYGNEWATTCFKQHLDYWSEDNTNAYYPRPRIGWELYSDNQKVQTRYLQDASYMRLKNVQVGYTIPTKWAEFLKMSSLRVYFSGENLYTFTNLTKIFDPEVLSGTYGSGKAYPLMKNFSFGVNINF